MKNKKYFSKVVTQLFLVAGFLFLIFSACQKNDIKVVSSELGTTTAGSTGTSGTNFPCSPALNKIIFFGSTFPDFTTLSDSSIFVNGYYTLHGYEYVNGYYRYVNIVLPSATAPTSSGIYTVNSGFWTSPNLVAGSCAVKFYQQFNGGYNYGYPNSGELIYIEVNGATITGAFCAVNCYGFDNSGSAMQNYQAGGKISN